ncbi:hypothetical protein [Aeromonas hydrophila]|uniref:hypothetical protein n=1 Tax=Aeromonas hydrophila TaxID=644 RepID=UPI003BF797DC
MSGGNLTLTSRGVLSSQAGSQLVSGGTLSLDGGTLTQQGLWQSARGMSLKGSRFEQQGDLLTVTCSCEAAIGNKMARPGQTGD